GGVGVRDSAARPGDGKQRQDAGSSQRRHRGPPPFPALKAFGPRGGEHGGGEEDDEGGHPRRARLADVGDEGVPQAVEGRRAPQGDQQKQPCDNGEPSDEAATRTAEPEQRQRDDGGGGRQGEPSPALARREAVWLAERQIQREDPRREEAVLGRLVLRRQESQANRKSQQRKPFPAASPDTEHQADQHQRQQRR